MTWIKATGISSQQRINISNSEEIRALVQHAKKLQMAFGCPYSLNRDALGIHLQAKHDKWKPWVLWTEITVP